MSVLLHRGALALAVVSVLGFVDSHAAPKGKGKAKEPAAPTADDFLGDLGKPSTGGGDDLKNAAGGVKAQEQKEEMAPRVEVQARDNNVHLRSVFMSNKIMITSGGCVQPGKQDKVASLNAADLPFIVQAFAVCARLESGRGRAVPVTFKIVTPKGRLVAQSEQVVDFGSKAQVDVVTDYPEMKFPVEGVYKYRMEVEGAVVSQVDLLDLKFTGARRPDAEETGP